MHSIASVRGLSSGLASLVLASALLGAGCASMTPAELDRQVTVSSQAPLYEYRRIGVEPVNCEGPICRGINGADVMRNLQRSLTDACYEVVDDTQFRQYYETFVGASPLGLFDWALGESGMTSPGAFKFNVLDPMAQQVIIDELGLDAMLKATLVVGEPSEYTNFRPTSIDYQLIDARRKNVLWHARLDGQIMDDKDATQTLVYMTNELAGAINRKANSCGEPQKSLTTEQVIQVSQGILDLPDRIYFELGSATISTRSYALLDDLALWFSQNPTVKLVRIEGHTDDVGDDNSNMTLSDQRAQSVHAYLAGKGVDPLRIEPLGFGETRPLVANDNPANRSKNRRVEFRVVN